MSAEEIGKRLQDMIMYFSTLRKRMVNSINTKTNLPNKVCEENLNKKHLHLL